MKIKMNECRILVVSVPNEKKKSKIEILDAILPIDKNAEIIEEDERNKFILKTNLSEEKAIYLILKALPRHTVRIIPIQATCEKDLGKIAEAARELLQTISNKKVKLKISCKIKDKKVDCTGVLRALATSVINNLHLEIVKSKQDLILHVEEFKETIVISILNNELPLSLHSLRERALNFIKNISL